MMSDFAEFSKREINARDDKAHFESLKQQNTNQNFEEKRQAIDKRSDEIKSKEQKRSEDGAVVSAGKTAGNAVADTYEFIVNKNDNIRK